MFEDPNLRTARRSADDTPPPCFCLARPSSVEASTTAPTQNMVTSNEATATPEPELALTAAGVDEATALAEVSAQSTRPAQIEATANATATATADASTPSATKRQTDEAPKPALSTEPPTKRARTGQDAEGRNRQRRLFGVLTKTLTKFQEDTKKESEAVSSSSQAHSD